MVAEILKTASDEVWRLVTRAGYPDELADPAQRARLAGLREAHVAAETEPVKLLGNLAAHRLGDAGAEARIADVIASADFPVRNDHAAMSLQRAFESYPAPVREGLLRRVAARLELPYRAHEYLGDAAVVDDGPIVEAALDPATPRSAARGAFAVIGPKTVGTLIDQLFALHEVYLGDRNAWPIAEQGCRPHVIYSWSRLPGRTPMNRQRTRPQERVPGPSKIAIEFAGSVPRSAADIIACRGAGDWNSCRG